MTQPVAQKRKPGPPKGVRHAGRQKGIKNKATIEREQRLLDELRGKAARLTPQVWAKDALEDLIPAAQNLVDSVRSVVANLQRLAFADLQAGRITKKLDKLKEWSALLKETEVAASLIMSRAGDFQSPKPQRIMVGIGIGMLGGAQEALPPPTDDGNVVQIDDPVAASRVYQRFVQRAA
jgi:hypothetical protein